jgi:multidrug resistance efflux pump
VGDAVRQGQVICELDQNDLLPRVRQSEAALGFAEATLKSALAEHERNKVEAAGPDVPFLKRDLDRARDLLLNKVISQTARDEAEKNYELGRNRQQQAQVNLGVSAASIKKAEAQVEQARALTANRPASPWNPTKTQTTERSVPHSPQHFQLGLLANPQAGHFSSDLR